MTTVFKAFWTLTDAQLQSSTVGFDFIEDTFDFIDYDDFMSACVTVGVALAGASDAAVRNTTMGVSEPTPLTGATDGPFSDIEDKAFFEFKNADTGGIHTFQLPAPEDTLFLADEETLDSTDALVAAVIAAIIALAVVGEQTWIFYKGYRRRARTRRGVVGAPVEV